VPRAKLVSLLGLSPGTPHTVYCLLEGEGYTITEHVILATSREAAEEARRILEACPCPQTGRPPAATTKTAVELLPFNDVAAQADLVELRRILRQHLDTATILDVSGGRKLMAVAAALEALNRGSAIVAAIVPDQVYESLRRAGEPCAKTAPDKAKLIKLA
jgi:hypothetical protein